jgi:uncharacterized protein YqeY
MTLSETIRADHKAARMARNKLCVKWLGTLLGETVKPGFEDGKRDSTDNEVLGVCRKYVNDLRSTIKDLDDRENESVQELLLVEQYLPQQYSEEKLTEVIASYVAEGNVTIPSLMPLLSKNHKGLFDGRLAKQIVMNLIKDL